MIPWRRRISPSLPAGCWCLHPVCWGWDTKGSWKLVAFFVRFWLSSIWIFGNWEGFLWFPGVGANDAALAAIAFCCSLVPWECALPSTVLPPSISSPEKSLASFVLLLLYSVILSRRAEIASFCSSSVGSIKASLSLVPHSLLLAFLSLVLKDGKLIFLSLAALSCHKISSLIRSSEGASSSFLLSSCDGERSLVT